MTRATELQSMVEEIYGKLAVVYHRAHEEGMKALSTGSPFKVGGGRGAAYGVGTYSTYDLESQLKPQMYHTYGRYIIKAKVNLNGFLIFDKDVLSKVYPSIRTVHEQLRKVFRLPERVIDDLDLAEPDHIPFRFESGNRYTSDTARYVYNALNEKVNRYFRGMVFTGRHDGRVVVIYDYKSVTPMSYANVPLPFPPPNQVKSLFKPVSMYAKETLGHSAHIDRPMDKGEFRVVFSRIGQILNQNGIRNGTINTYSDRGDNLVAVEGLNVSIPPNMSEKHIVNLIEKTVLSHLPGFRVESDHWFEIQRPDVAEVSVYFRTDRDLSLVPYGIHF